MLLAPKVHLRTSATCCSCSMAQAEGSRVAQVFETSDTHCLTFPLPSVFMSGLFPSVHCVVGARASSSSALGNVPGCSQLGDSSAMVDDVVEAGASDDPILGRAPGGSQPETEDCRGGSCTASAPTTGMALLVGGQTVSTSSLPFDQSTAHQRSNDVQAFREAILTRFLGVPSSSPIRPGPLSGAPSETPADGSSLPSLRSRPDCDHLAKRPRFSNDSAPLTPSAPVDSSSPLSPRLLIPSSLLPDVVRTLKVAVGHEVRRATLKSSPSPHYPDIIARVANLFPTYPPFLLKYLDSDEESLHPHQCLSS